MSCRCSVALKERLDKLLGNPLLHSALAILQLSPFWASEKALHVASSDEA